MTKQTLETTLACETVTGLAAQWAVFEEIPHESYSDAVHELRSSVVDKLIDTRSTSRGEVVRKLHAALALLAPDEGAFNMDAEYMIKSAICDLDTSAAPA
ncbi:MAG: hypothetical protein B7Y80_20150 [Hyphomicrobium sp. 32-62-53]|nr:MAG: hypothetical protein B7Z29_19980 [Hyphomicrobium sp. 12-62-95]OYX97346.1 MAG: hypothetical protein B7Y80_20150 [Hyphomicrobium sp. 32-62-53]